MKIEKELNQIAEGWTEEEYRARPELSYSTLATYEREGFDNLDHLFDKKENPALTQGSVLDCIITGGADEFNERFIVRDINITDSGMATCKILASVPQPYGSFNDIPERIISQAAKEAGFWQADKWDNVRYKKLLETGDLFDYYNSLVNADKTVITTQVYEEAVAMARALRESPATSGYFADDDEMSPIRRYYQLKFKANLDGVGYRVMMDEVVVDYEKKVIYPIDLKSSGHSEWEFEDSFLKWSYMIQSRLYFRVLKANLLNDPYFKDFEVKNYRFIVVNKKTLTPLVWEFPYTQYVGTLVDEKGNEYRDPFEIGKELRGYLDCRPQVPNGINLIGTNVINCLKPKMN